MKAAQTILAFVLAGLLAGCVVHGKQPVASNIPPPPQPVVEPVAAAQPQPLSIPQTQIELPPPQPVSQEAMAAARPPDETTEAPATAPRGSGGTHRTAAPQPIAQPKPEAPAPTTPPAGNPPAPATAPDNSPRIQEIVPPTEQRRLQDLAEARKKESRQLLDQAATRHLNHRETGLKRSIESFLKLSDQAEAKGDMRQAADYADRALTLAKDLQSGR